MLRIVLSLFAIGYLPGALIFRLPTANRPRRASLPVEERAFWSIVLSLALSSAACLCLAAAGAYRFDRLLWFIGVFSLLSIVMSRGRLRLADRNTGLAFRPATLTWTALLPIVLAVAGLYIIFLVPPSEYVIGGKDPGVYTNEGVQIAQRGALTPRDEVVRSVPPQYRDLFFSPSPDPTYYSNRFMGFFLLNPETGAVVGQFPHLYPAWMAIGYGVNGLMGVRWVTGVAAVLGLLAVYFAGARLLGRAAAFAGAGLLALHVVQIWYARYPNAEIVMQPLVFAGLAAYARAEMDEDRFFAPVAAVLLTLAVFAHLSALLAIGGVAAAAVFGTLDGRRPSLTLVAPLVAGIGLAAFYMVTVLPPYFQVPLGFVRNLRAAHVGGVALLVAVAALLMQGARRPAFAAAAKRWSPIALTLIVWSAAAYAYFLRSAGGTLAVHDADALRTYTSFYLSRLGLAATLIGFAILARRSIWFGGALLFTSTIFSLFFFYKIRIVPEHFWAARRFLAVILPSSLLLVGAAAFCSFPLPNRWRGSWIDRSGASAFRYGLGTVLILMLAARFLAASSPILRFVEYAGLIPHLEQLAAKFGDEDLVLVESRGASDAHVLGLPLAYIYDRKVLVLATTSPDKTAFREFLRWARGRYKRIFFVGGGGTELLSRTLTVDSSGGERFQVPEYESAWNDYPRSVRSKEFDFGIYEFVARPRVADGFNLDVGEADDLYVRRFLAKERRPDGSTYRWTRDVSYVSILGTKPDQRQLTLWMADGGRPAAAGPATVEIFLNDARLGEATVSAAGPYQFLIPPELAASLAQFEDAAQLRIVSRTWSPAKVMGSTDTRDLGVMVDRIEIR